MSRARVRELASFSSSNFLVHIAKKIVFSTDVIVVGIVLGAAASGVYAVPAKLFALAFGIGTAVTSLMYPAFAELEGAGASERQRRLLLTGLRGGTALMLLLALPFLLIPDLLIHAWIGDGYEDGYSVLAILAGVLLVHQPIYVLTQFLIARARQREGCDRLDRGDRDEPRAVVRARVDGRPVGRRALDARHRRRRARARPADRRSGRAFERGRPGARDPAARSCRRPPRRCSSSSAPRGCGRRRRCSSSSRSASPGRSSRRDAMWRFGLAPEERARLARELRGGRGRVAPEPV